MPRKTVTFAIISVIGALLLNIWTCSLPSDPFIPSNTRLSLVVKSPTLSPIGKSVYIDTLGTTARVGIATNLTNNVDSAYLSLEFGSTDFDTTVLFSDFSSMNRVDTAWMTYTYRDTGSIALSAELFVQGLEPRIGTAQITVYARENHAPAIIVSDDKTVEAGMPCTLTFGANDPDAGQKLHFSVDSLPEGAEFDTANNFFRWTPEASNTGTHQFVFRVVDNGFPPLVDEDTVTVTVTPAKEYHAPAWDAHTLQKRLQASALFELDLSELCSDADGDNLTFTLVEGDPSDDAVTTNTYSWEPSAENTGTFYVTIIAEDPSSMTDTVVIELTVFLQDSTGPSLTLVAPDDSTVTANDTETVTVTCKDLSGVEYVHCTVGSDTFEVTNDDTLYTATVTGLQGGEYTTIMFTAADGSDNHNAAALMVYVKYDDDTELPTVTKVTPDKDSVSTNSASYTITLACDDASGIKSVEGTMGEATFTGSLDTENKWVITADDLEEGVYNEVTVTVIDASLQENVTSVQLYIMYDPTMDDVDGPTLLRVSGLESGDIVTGAVIARVDSIYDPSGIDSVYWIRGGEVRLMTPVTTSETGGTYALQDTLLEYHLDTLDIVVVDASTAHNRTSKRVVVDYNVPPVVRDTAIATYLGTAVTFTSAVVSTDGDAISWSVTGDPEHGTAEFDGAECTYTPESGWDGVDSFSVEASDGVWSDTMQVIVTVAPTYTLTVNRTATGGTVAVEKDTAAYYAGDEVTLTASPNASYRFVGWSGDTTATVRSLTVTMRKNRTISATFIKTFTVTAAVDNSIQGSIAISAGASPATVDSGKSVTVTANEKTGYRFTGWGGDASGATSPKVLTVTKDLAVSAAFKKTYVLTIVSSNAAKGTVSTAAGTSPVSVDSGVAVSIKAIVASGYKFKGWSVSGPGAVFGGANLDSTTVKLSGGNVTVTGEFGCLTFAKQISFAQYTDINLADAVQTSDGGYLIVGSTGAYPNEEPIMIKLDQQGDTAFSKRFNLLDDVSSIQKVPSGYVVAGKYSDDATFSCFAQNGNLLWTYVYYFGEYSSTASSVKGTKNGGYVLGGLDGGNWLMVNVSSTRDTLWTNEIGVVTGITSDCIEARDGGLVFVGVGCAGLCPKAVKMSTDGNVVWDKSGSDLTTLASPGSLSSVDTTNDGGIIIVGDGNASGASQGFIIKMKTDGTVENDLAITDATHLSAIKSLPNGDFLVAGGTLSLGTGGGENIYITRLNSAGAVQSASAYGVASDERARSLQLTTDGGAIVVGSGNWIIKTDENGLVD